MVVQQWPGSGPAHIGYGVPGSISLDENLDVLSARQHSVGGFINGGTKKILDPVRPNRFLKNDYPSKRQDAIEAFMSSLDLGGIDSEALAVLEHESQVLISPATIDPLLGRRISMMANDSPSLLYADDNFVHLVSLDTDEIETRINMRSPVMQTDLNGLVRTRKGLVKVGEDDDINHIMLGEYMHVSGRSAAEALTISESGLLTLFDISAGQSKWEESRPRGTIGGWSRVSAAFDGNASLGLWCNRYLLTVVDFREPPRAPGSTTGYYPSNSDSRTILNFEDRQSEIHDLDSGVDGADAIVLTSYDIRWVVGGKPAVSLIVDHPLASSDYSKNLYKGKHSNHTLSTVTSQLAPMTIANILGVTCKLPSLLDDPYFIECWPSIIPQSHITVENSNGCALYSVGAEGGLYKQQWNETGFEEVLDDIIDMPQPDLPSLVPKSRPESLVSQVEKTKPFDLLSSGTPMYSYDFSKYYDLAFEPFGDRHTDNLPAAEQVQAQAASMSHVDASSRDDFRDSLAKMWIAPIQKKTIDNPDSVDSAVLSHRSECLETIVKDMEELGKSYRDGRHWQRTPSLLDPDVDDILSLWKISGEPDLDGEEHAPSSPSSPGILSQPTQLQAYGMNDSMNSSQLEQYDMPQSQPMPTLGLSKRKSHMLKRKHKHKKHKKRDRNESSSQP